MAVIMINGREFPAPDIGGNLVVATNVSDGKNANGEFVGQKVGRDQYKFDSLQWKMLDAQTWAAMYPGNRTATPVQFDKDGLPTVYQDCKVNIIDCGVME